MSAPKTAEGRAAALAKRRETTRARPIAEVRAELERLSKQVRRADRGEDGSEWSRDCDLEIVGSIVELAASYLTRKPVPERTRAELERVKWVLLDARDPMKLTWLPCRQFGIFSVDSDGLRAIETAVRGRVELTSRLQSEKREEARAQGAAIARAILDADGPEIGPEDEATP